MKTMFVLAIAIALTAFTAGAYDYELSTLNHTLATNLLSAGPAASNNLPSYTATLSITNGTTNNQVVSVNGRAVTWITNVTQQSVQVGTNSTAAGSATNLYNYFLSFPIAGAAPAWASSTSFTFSSASPFTITNTAGWLSAALATNTTTLTGNWVRVENKRYHTVHITGNNVTNTIFLDRSLDGTNYVCWATNNPSTTAAVELQCTGEWAYMRARMSWTNGSVSVQYLGGR